ncbi:MAG TPA: hypothetical protein ENJ56_04160, partial [Anaerolineae bacterium]|nr:hypothetical protein [Anaerolineae bacterium]
MRKPLASLIFHPLTFIFFLAGLAAAPLFKLNGLFNTHGGGDSPFLLQRTHQMVTALRMGQFPVRWMPDGYFGYGYPFFNFYAPLSIYVSAVFKLIGFSYTRAIQMAQLAGFMLAAWAMYRFVLRVFDSQLAAVLAAAVYTFAPFHLVNVYVRGDSLAEFWAMAFYPLVLGSAENLLQSPPQKSRWRYILALAFAFAGLVLSHNISALIFAPFLLLYSVIGIVRHPATHAERGRLLGAFALAALLGVGLSAWFWLPALAEQNLVQLAEVTQGYFHYAGHFRPLSTLVQPTLRFDFGISNGQTPFRMGLSQVGLLVLGLLGSGWQWRRWDGVKRRFGVVSLLIVLGATFMIIPASGWLWQHLPLLAFTQFPWRFLSLQALGVAMLVGGGFSPRRREGAKEEGGKKEGIVGPPRRRAAKEEGEKKRGILVGVLLVFVVWAGLAGVQREWLYLTDADVSAEMLSDYEWFGGNIGTTISAEYLPAAVQPRAWQGGAAHASVLRGQATIEQSAAQLFMISVLSDRATLMLPVLQWGGTRVSSGEIVAAGNNGLLTVELVRGEHEVRVTQGRTTVEWVAELLSLLTMLFVIALVVRNKISVRKPLGVVAILLLIALI